MIKSNRIEKLTDSPCYNCGLKNECGKKIKKNYHFGVIRDNMFGNKELDYHDCGIWIALTANVEEVENG